MDPEAARLLTLASLGAGCAGDPGAACTVRRVGLSLQGGVRDETSNVEIGIDTQLGWYGVDLDVMLGQHWLYLVSVERNEGDDGSWQLYTALTWRF